MLSRQLSVVLAGVKTEELSQLELVLLIKRICIRFSESDARNVYALFFEADLDANYGEIDSYASPYGGAKGVVLLNEYQSAVALQYALALERATSTFGTQRLAENWLEKPCSQLSGEIPLEMLGNLWGYRLVVSYLDRVVLGVYQ